MKFAYASLCVVAVALLWPASVNADDKSGVSDESTQDTKADVKKKPAPKTPEEVVGKPSRPSPQKSGSGPPVGKKSQKEGPSTGPANNEDTMAVVERFLEMPPEELATIRTMLERIEQMTPEERNAMRKRIASYRQMTDERRERMLKEFNQVPVQERLLLRKYWKSLPPEQAKKERTKLNSMHKDKRPAYRKELLEKARKAGITLSPPPPPKDVNIPPPPELIPPPFPGFKTPPPPPASFNEKPEKVGGKEDTKQD